MAKKAPRRPPLAPPPQTVGGNQPNQPTQGAGQYPVNQGAPTQQQFYRPPTPQERINQASARPDPRLRPVRYNAAGPVETITRTGERRTIVPQGTPVTRNTLEQLRTLTSPAEQSIQEQRTRTGQFTPRLPEESEGFPSYSEGGQQFGLPEGDPNTTMRGKFAAFMGGPMGTGLQVGGAALGGAALGFAVGGPIGAAIGGLGMAGLTYGGMEYQKYLEHAYGLAEAQKRFDESFFGQMGKVLDVPRQGLEQVIGTGVQLAVDPTDTLNNLDAAWKAARLTYESAPVDIRALDPGRWLAGTTPSLVNTGSFQTFVDYDLPETSGGLMALVEARRRIAAGEPEANVFAEIQGRYGAPGQLRELLSGFVLDPLNYTGPLENLGLRGVAKIARADDLAQAARLARLEQPLGGGLIDTFQIYRNLKTMKVLREGFQDARSLNWLQRALVGEDILRTLDGTYTPPKPWEFWRLTPESLARERVVQASNYLQSYISGAIPLDENFPTESARLITGMRNANLNQNLDDLDPAARAMLTLEGQVVQKGLREGGAVELDTLRAWQDTARERALLEDMAAKLKQAPAQIIQRAASGEDVLTLYRRAGGSDDLLKRAGVLSADSATPPTPPLSTAGGQLNPKPFTEIAKAWQGGVPHSLPEYRAALMSGLIEQTGQWAAKFFQLKGPGFLERLTGTVKAIQSPILLGLNPGYLINNILSNGVTSVARGALGLRGLTEIIDDLNRHGLSPARLAQGVTAAELDELGNGAKLWGERMADAGTRAITDATEAPAGPLSNVRQAANKIASAAPFLKWSQGVEKAFSVATYGEGFRQMWSKVWRKGVGFDAMPKALEQALAELDSRLPGHIYAAVEAGYNASDIAARVLDAAPKPHVQQFYASVAQTLGLDGERLSDLMQLGGVEQALNAGLARLPDSPTTQDIRTLMNDVRVRAEQHLSQLEAEQAKIQYEFVAQAAGQNESGLIDPGALLEVFDAQRIRLTETFTSHKRLLEEIWDERLRGAIDTREFVTRYRQAGRDLYRNGLFVEERASIDGLAAGLKRADMPLDDGFTLAKRSQHQLAEDFFKYKEQRLDDFFALDKELRTGEQWNQVQRDIDAAYTNLTGHTEQLQSAMDDYLAAAYERRFPGSGERIKTWRELVREHDAAYSQAVTAQFEAARNLPDPMSRHKLWREFDERMLGLRKDWTAEEIQARRAIWEAVPGRENLEGGRLKAEGQPQTAESAGQVPTADSLQREVVAQAELEQAQDAQAVAAEFWDLERRMMKVEGDADPELVTRYRYIKSEYTRLFGETPSRQPVAVDDSGVTFNISRRRTEIVAANLTPAQEELLKIFNWRKEKSTGVWYARGEHAEEGRRLSGELPLRPFEEKRLENIQRKLNPLPLEESKPTTAGSVAQAVRVPRSELPPELSAAIEQQAQQMLREVMDGEPGARVFVRGTDEYLTGDVLAQPSTYPDWYGALNTRRETILNALKKIVTDQGADVDKAGQTIIRKVKQALIDELAKTDPVSGRPPEPEILRWLGRGEDEVNAATQAWANAGAEPQVKPWILEDRHQYQLGIDNRPPLTDDELDVASQTPGLYGLTETALAGLTPERLSTRREAIAFADRLRLSGESDVGLEIDVPPPVGGQASPPTMRPPAPQPRGLIGNAISKNFRDLGQTKLIGHRVQTASDLAALAQVYRNPRFETFRYFFMQGDEIVGQVGIGARLPGMTTWATDEFDLAALQNLMQSHEADGYYVLHNHPGGIPTPSDEDRLATMDLERQLPGFRGHVIIDDTDFYALQPGGQMGNGLYPLGAPQQYTARGAAEAIQPHPVLGRSITNIDELAAVAKELQTPADFVTLVSLSARREVRGLTEVSPQQYRTPTRTLAAVRRFAQDTGATDVIAVFPQGFQITPEILQMLNDGRRVDILLDAVIQDEQGKFVTLGQVLDKPQKGYIFGKRDEQIRFTVREREAPYLLPPGVLSENGATPTPHAAMESEAYYRQLRPALAELQKQMEAHVGQGRVRGHETLPPELQQGVNTYLRGVGRTVGDAKLMSMKWGEFKRDASLLNYSRRYVADTYLGMVAPYQFWSTHSMIKWAMHSIQSPALLAHYYRTKRFLETSVTKPGFPSRLIGKIKIPLPWMPEWMGGGVWVDPLKLGTPFENFSAPWENFQQGQLKLETRVQRELEAMAERGEITAEEMQAALESRRTDMVSQVAGQGGNELWNRVSQQVVSDDQSLRFDGGDLATMLYSPSLPLKWAYEYLRGTPERIGPLPVTRDAKNLTAALGVGGPGGVNLEGGLRRALGLPIFDQWSDYRIDRELSNMAGEGVITAEQAQAAMIERAGPAYDQAAQREALQGGADVNVQIFGRLFGGASVFPEGEQTQRELNELFKAARQAQDNGDVDALNNFLEDHPEFEARLALNQEPAERLQNFLVDQVWAGWNALPELYKREVRGQLGETFEQAFMNRETRSYTSIPADTLATWARTLGRYVPGNVDGPPMQLELAPPAVAAEAQQFYDTRAAVWDMTRIRALQTGYFQIPDGARATREPLPEAVTQFYKQKESLFPGIGQWVSAYYDLPKGKPRREFLKAVPQLQAYFAFERGWKDANPEEAAYLKSAPSARSQYMDDHPELAQYWDWRRQWMDGHPVSASYLTESTPAGVGENAQPTGEQESERRGVEILASPEMQWLVTAHVFAGERFPPMVDAMLTREWEAQGKPERDRERWLLNVLAYGGNLGMGGYMQLPQMQYYYPTQ